MLSVFTTISGLEKSPFYEDEPTPVRLRTFSFDSPEISKFVHPDDETKLTNDKSD